MVHVAGAFVRVRALHRIESEIGRGDHARHGPGEVAQLAVQLLAVAARARGVGVVAVEAVAQRLTGDLLYLGGLLDQVGEALTGRLG